VPNGTGAVEFIPGTRLAVGWTEEDDVILPMESTTAQEK
jgi:hypothetical protein